MSYNLAGVIWNDDGTMAIKELSPLEASKQLKDFIFELELGNVDKLFVKGSFDIIETTLRNYEELTNKPVILYGRTYGHTKALIDMICKNYKEVKITNLEDEKKLKAFEIIKEEPMFPIYVEMYENAYEMILDRPGFAVNQSAEELQEKFDILKEYFK